MEHLTLPLLRRDRFYCFPESAGYYQGVRNHEVRRPSGALQEFNLHLVTAGQGHVQCAGQLFELKAGEAFLYFPGEEQFYFADPAQAWDVKWIHFYGGGVLTDLAERGFRRSVVWRIRAPIMLERRIDELLREMERYRSLYPSKISMLLYGVIAELVEQAEPLSAGTFGAASVERILSLLPEMQSSACLPFELNDWAARAGTNRFAFCRRFRQATGQTPLEFVTLCRIGLAKQLLIERPALAVAEVASRAGYDSPGYFNKKFLEIEKMTPTAYRQLFAIGTSDK